MAEKYECQICEADNMTSQEAVDHRQNTEHPFLLKKVFPFGKVGGSRRVKFKDPWEGSFARE